MAEPLRRPMGARSGLAQTGRFSSKCETGKRTAGEALTKPVRAPSRYSSHAAADQLSRCRLTACNVHVSSSGARARARARASARSQLTQFVSANLRDDSPAGSASSAAMFQSSRHSRKPARLNSHAAFGDQPTTHSTVLFVECVEPV